MSFRSFESDYCQAYDKDVALWIRDYNFMQSFKMEHEKNAGRPESKCHFTWPPDQSRFADRDEAYAQAFNIASTLNRWMGKIEEDSRDRSKFEERLKRRVTNENYRIRNTLRMFNRYRLPESTKRPRLEESAEPNYEVSKVPIPNYIYPSFKFLFVRHLQNKFAKMISIDQQPTKANRWK